MARVGHVHTQKSTTPLRAELADARARFLLLALPPVRYSVTALVELLPPRPRSARALPLSFLPVPPAFDPPSLRPYPLSVWHC